MRWQSKDEEEKMQKKKTESDIEATSTKHHLDKYDGAMNQRLTEIETE